MYKAKKNEVTKKEKVSCELKLSLKGQICLEGSYSYTVMMLCRVMLMKANEIAVFIKKGKEAIVNGLYYVFHFGNFPNNLSSNQLR